MLIIFVIFCCIVAFIIKKAIELEKNKTKYRAPNLGGNFPIFVVPHEFKSMKELKEWLDSQTID